MHVPESTAFVCTPQLQVPTSFGHSVTLSTVSPEVMHRSNDGL